MKYMHSEWRRRLDHWLDTLKRDFYHPLGTIPVEAAFTMEHLSPAEAMTQSFAPITPGTPWGKTWAYCWLRGTVTLPAEAAGKRIVMDLNTGGETTVFVDGRVLRDLPGRVGGGPAPFPRGQLSVSLW